MKIELNFKILPNTNRVVNEARIELLTHKYNRSVNQTKFLLELLEYDYSTYEQLELAMFNNGVFYCPSTTEEIDNILKLKPQVDWCTKRKSDRKYVFNSPILGKLRDTKELTSFQQAQGLVKDNGYHFFNWFGVIYHVNGNPTGLSEEELL